MSAGSRSRRIAVGTAVWTMVALTLSGCHGVPIGRLVGPPPIPNQPQSIGAASRAALLPATVALEVPTEMAAIDPRNSATGTVTRASALGDSARASLISTDAPAGSAAPAAEPLPPTPLLDAALIQARNRGELPASAPAEPGAAPIAPPPAAVDPSVAAAGPEPKPEAGAVEMPAPINSPPIPTAPPVVATPEPKPAEVAAPPLPPEELWRDGVRKLVGLARAKQEQGGQGGTEPWGLRARVLAWLAEPDIDPDLGGRDPDGVRAVLHALEADDPKTVGESRLRANDIRTALQTIQAKAPLEVVDLQVCREVRAFGDFVPFGQPGRHAGEMVVIYCEVDGLHHEPTPNGYQTRLAGRLELIPEGGGPTLAVPLESAEEVFPRRRRDYYINYLKQLPGNLAPGRYTMRITLRDALADRSASRSTLLTITDEKGAEAAPRP